MLVDFWTKTPITSIPFQQDYHRWMSRMSPAEIAGVEAELNARISGTEIKTAARIPGSDWTGTPFEPIYEKAARRDPAAAAKCFGLMVWKVIMERPERWTSGRFEKDGEPIASRTYFIVK